MTTQEPPRPPPFAVALFDVLGFENLLRTEGLTQVHHKYRVLIERAVQIPDNRFADLVDGHIVLGWMPNLHAYFSDTILLWHPLERLFARPFVGRCANMVALALEMGMPLRGAIALGPAELDKDSNIYLGEPIIEAARLQAQQEWVGLAFTASAMWPNWVAEMSAHDIVPYRIPLKSEAAREDLCGGFAVNWCRRLQDGGIALLESLRDRLPSSEASIRRKYDNTIAFVRAAHEWVARVEREKLSGFRLVTPDQVEREGIKDPLRLK